MEWPDLVAWMAIAYVAYKVNQYRKIITLLARGQEEILEDLTRPPAKRGRC